MGLIADTSVFIRTERPTDLSPWSAIGPAFISAITVSELLVGVHRANTEERRTRRAIFVEGIVSTIPVLDFTTEVARVHAELFAELATAGQTIGAHDLLIAATAAFHDFDVLTANPADFQRVPRVRCIVLPDN